MSRYLSSHEVVVLEVAAQVAFTQNASSSIPSELRAIITAFSEPRLCLDQLRTDQWDVVCGLPKEHPGLHRWAITADRRLEVQWDG